MAYTIIYTRDAKRQLKALRPYDRNEVEEAIDRHLAHNPDVESNKIKRLRDHPIADWELRVGDWRVLYNIHADVVEIEIVAIGRKRRERLYIDGEEVRS